jgi:hypothetical protein
MQQDAEIEIFSRVCRDIWKLGTVHHYVHISAQSIVHTDFTFSHSRLYISQNYQRIDQLSPSERVFSDDYR